MKKDILQVIQDLLKHRTEDAGCYEFVLEAWIEEAAAEIARLRDAIRRLADQDATLSVCDGNVTVTMDEAMSEAEIDAIECVVEDGRIASMSVYGVMRSLLVRLRPERESQSYEKSDEKRANTNTNRDTTPSEGSVQEECALTDEEREAITMAVSACDVEASLNVACDGRQSFAGLWSDRSATLRKLLERLS